MYLNVHTYYSFKYGVINTKDLLRKAQEIGVEALVLTDINTSAACLNFVRLSKEFAVRPILGIDVRRGAKQLFVAIAKNNEGFYELNEFISPYLHNKKELPERAPKFKHVFVIYPFQQYTGFKLKPYEYIGIKPEDLPRLIYPPHQMDQNKLVILATWTFRSKIENDQPKLLKQDFNAHRLLRAIDNNTLLSKLPKSEEGSKSDFFYPPQPLQALYAAYPYMWENSQQLIDQCHIDFEFGTDKPHKNLSTYTGTKNGDYSLLEKLAYSGLNYRYQSPDKQIYKRIKLELDLIRKKGFMSYFLINWDICSYARSQGYFYVGRGSGANSIIAYLLRITDVDPIELDLYFERFINLYRQNPPDFDIDFSWTDRQDVTDYIFKRFPNVCLLATYSTFQFKAVAREIGKVLGLPPHEIDHISEVKYEELDEMARLVVKYGQLIHGFPSHLSIHAGGILISEKPIHYFTATDLPPKGFPTTHFDMLIAEDVGLYKFDILAQRGLAKIKDSLAIIEHNNPRDPRFDIHNISAFKQDEQVKYLLREGKAIGCFYVESPAMRMLLKKLRVDEYLGLVAASSVIRPGVAQSGMMRQYILRFREPERRNDAHPVMREIMPETFGVMVYQEDVIKVAHYFAGLTLGEADVLRRGMSGKYRSREEFQKIKEKFFSNCTQKGYAEEMAKEIWRQIESFAGYAFAKGHSASYAVESYQSLFLKAHYPLEYMVACLNNGGGFYRPEIYAHEAIMHGGIIEPPCVNRSNYLCTILGKHIFIGLGFISELEKVTAKEIMQKRAEGGEFKGLDEFLKRVSISLEQLSLLIRIGAFRFTTQTKKQLLWEAHFQLGNTKKSNPMKMLFNAGTRRFELPPLSYHKLEDAFDQIELLGFPLCNPFDLLKDEPQDEVLVNDMARHLHKTISMVGYLVHIKRTTTKHGKRMYFGTFLDRAGYFLDTTHFPGTNEKHPFRGKGIYQITGKVVEEFEYLSLEVIALKKLVYVHDPRIAEEARHATMNVSNE